jgi:uncharacterized protein YabN with tetrapyrrole methylase and pyrophosphatase domain
LIVVGAGINLAVHCSQEAREWIAAADVVYSVMSNPIAQAWLEGLNSHTVSLQSLYQSAPDRPTAYAAMADAIVAAVREGKTVCAVFYGHPGVFVSPSHVAIRKARAEGFEARMLPAISAEDCLFADLGVDPAASGCQSYEARDFFINARVFDPSAALILWQVAVLGDETYSAFEAKPGWLEALARVLMEHYPGDHQVTLYEAAPLPVMKPRMEQRALRDLANAAVTQATTLYVPPFGAPGNSSERLALLRDCCAEAEAGSPA